MSSCIEVLFPLSLRGLYSHKAAAGSAPPAVRTHAVCDKPLCSPTLHPLSGWVASLQNEESLPTHLGHPAWPFLHMPFTI